MIKIGILSFSDGRKRVHESLSTYIKEHENKIIKALYDPDRVEIIVGDHIIWNPHSARDEAGKMNAYQVDCIIFNIPVFAFPNFVLISAKVAKGPFLAISPVNGKMPGLGGLLAISNLLAQNSIKCEKVWGDIDDTETLKKINTFVKAAYAISNMIGQTYGLFGGRSIGIGTGTANPDMWMKTFGIDIEHVDQLEIIRRAETIDDEKTNKAFEWLSKNVGTINYDNDKLTEETLKAQIKCYYATKDIINEKDMDFVGVKCHYEMSEYNVAQCLSAAFFNDPYDWDGPKEPIVFACEADSDGALTMQILKLISGLPAIFCDFRHYDKKDGVFTFCNCGAMASWYSERDDSPEENLKSVSLYPLISKYAGKGCHVQYIAKEGIMTLARLTHSAKGYKMTIFTGECKRYPSEKLNETCPQWPHIFLKVAMDPIELIERYENNHVHGVFGEYVDELKMVCKLLDIDCEVIE